jgi:hypothetical protein
MEVPKVLQSFLAAKMASGAAKMASGSVVVR